DSILLLTSKSFYKKGLTKILEDKLGDRLKGVIYDILPNPEINYAELIKKDYRNYKEIIAFGGGSVLDMAKYFSVSGDVIRNGGNLDISNSCSFIPIFAIPTTAGTSSELTKWATLWDTP
ncbi:iron-containing alcohol dehydrogenase, partial [Campylobacter jejuni]